MLLYCGKQISFTANRRSLILTWLYYHGNNVLQVHHLLIPSASHANSYGRLSTWCFEPSAPTEGFRRESIFMCASKGVLTSLIVEYLASDAWNSYTLYQLFPLEVGRLLSVWQQLLTTRWLVLVRKWYCSGCNYTTYRRIIGVGSKCQGCLFNLVIVLTLGDAEWYCSGVCDVNAWFYMYFQNTTFFSICHLNRSLKKMILWRSQSWLVEWWISSNAQQGRFSSRLAKASPHFTKLATKYVAVSTVTACEAKGVGIQLQKHQLSVRCDFYLVALLIFKYGWLTACTFIRKHSKSFKQYYLTFHYLWI